MTRALAGAALAVLLGVAAPAAEARHGFGGHGHGSFHGRGSFHGHGFHHGHGFFGGVYFDPFPYWSPYSYWAPYSYWSPYPYGYPYPYAYPPEPPETTFPEEEDDVERRAEAPAPRTSTASYGLVQLKGVPEAASVDLDGRFWLTGESLDQRWLALPAGTHTIAVRARGSEPVERRVTVKPGRTQVVRFGPFRTEPD